MTMLECYVKRLQELKIVLQKDHQVKEERIYEV
jgi:hypothetical protein